MSGLEFTLPVGLHLEVNGDPREVSRRVERDWRGRERRVKDEWRGCEVNRARPRRARRGAGARWILGRRGGATEDGSPTRLRIDVAHTPLPPPPTLAPSLLPLLLSAAFHPTALAAITAAPTPELLKRPPLSQIPKCRPGSMASVEPDCMHPPTSNSSPTTHCCSTNYSRDSHGLPARQRKSTTQWASAASGKLRAAMGSGGKAPAGPGWNPGRRGRRRNECSTLIDLSGRFKRFRCATKLPARNRAAPRAFK
ncbi:hypothetical protein FB45DRAFT_997052 [Roridomyces roridus]|uniref:Uncharacterized protein n=1 Tax=Roridomyces roridus TaxID=1738132 RepID=A0AAD7CI51_9AGAR|nr:hypothetical protein FB45DRAFT_997052 [Roridomyces roridus]